MEYSINSYISSFPRQKLSKSRKTSAWGESNVEAGIKLKGLYNTSRRSPITKKIRNYNLYNGKFDKDDLGYELQPLLGKDYTFPADLQYKDIATPIFQTLLGEEAKRGLSFVVRAINEEAITQKEKEKKDLILQALQQRIMSVASEQEKQQFSQGQAPEDIQSYFTYSFQDIREKNATYLLSYYKKYLHLDKVFQKGWEDSIIAGEEIYCVEEVSNEPIVRRCNPLEMYYLLPHNSDLVDDAQVILEETYMSISKIIDDFYEYLTPTQIDMLEEKITDKDYLAGGQFSVPGTELPPRQSILTEEELIGGGLLASNSYYDPHGNIRVCKVTWKSMRKVGTLTYTDEAGQEQELLVDETFKMPLNEGMNIEWFWINEYWEGTKVGDDIYLNIRPKKLQFRRIDNLSACKSGYIGTVYNCNNSQSVSLMDRLVPWLYQYAVMWYRTDLLIAANQGRIAKIDLSLVPDGWELDKWLHYATAMKFAFVDSFNEGKKGAATGKLAGMMQNQGGELNLETGNAIQGHIELLGFIEQKLMQLSGVTPQRMGDISPSELVGNVQASLATSATVTEPWFQVHNWTKQRVLEALIEVAKETLSTSSKKLQYVADDMATVFFEIDGNEFSNAEYGVFVTNSAKDTQILDMLKQLTQAAMQNDKIQMSNVIDIMMGESIADIKNKLIQAEAKQAQAKQAEQQQAIEGQQKSTQMLVEDKIKERDWKSSENQLDRESKERVATIGTFFKQPDTDMDNDGVPDVLEIMKHTDDIRLKEKELDLRQQEIKQTAKDNEADRKLKSKDIDTKLKIAKSRPKPSKKK